MQNYPPGTRIGQYEIASLPMMGGMGVVYFALDHGNDGRPVALKTFRPELLPDRAARDRFLREGTAWIELGSHPHIVRCYKVEYIDPTAFLVLELIAKEQNMPDASLRSWLIPGRPLPLEQALLFALQIARGMQHATEKIPGFVHRDLKPENILVGADKLSGTNINRLRVTDFGLVKTIAGGDISAMMSSAEELKPNQVQFTRGVGTPLYMAPEQWKGESVGVFTDVYAFGCILYEILCGQRVAGGMTIKELEASHCNGRLRPIPSNLIKDVNSLVIKCLALEPDQRYKNWEDLIDEIGHACSKQNDIPVPCIVDSNELSQDELAQVGWSYGAMGVAYKDMGKAEVAAVYFEKALSLARKTNDRGGEGANLGNLGLAYVRLGKLRQAIVYHEQHFSIACETDDRNGQGAALNNLGEAYRNLGEARRAIEYYEQSLAIMREIGNRPAEGVYIGNLGLAYADLGETHRAIEYLKQGLMIARETDDRRGEETALGNLGMAYGELDEIQQAIEYYEQYLKIAYELGDRRGEGIALCNLGSAYVTLDNMQRAIEYYKQYLDIAYEIGDRRGQGAVLGNLGVVYKNLGEVHQAIEYYQQYLEIALEIEDRRGEAIALGNLGNAYVQVNDASQAVECYEKALVIGREIGDLNSVAMAYYNIALLHLQQKDPARSLPLAQEAKQIWAQLDSPKVQNAQQLINKLNSS